MVHAYRRKLTVKRSIAYMNTIPPEQPIIEIYDGPKRIATMGRWSALCLPEGCINALDATDEQILRAYTTDEPVI